MGSNDNLSFPFSCPPSHYNIIYEFSAFIYSLFHPLYINIINQHNLAKIIYKVRNYKHIEKLRTNLPYSSSILIDASREEPQNPIIYIGRNKNYERKRHKTDC